MPAGNHDATVLWDDLRPVLDQEVDRLPEKYRAPVVLCYLDGKTRDLITVSHLRQDVEQLG